MRLVIPAVLCGILLSGPRQANSATPPQSDSNNQAQENGTSQRTTITVPAGTKVILALTSPVWAKTAKLGDSVYSTSAFPVAVNGAIAIPPGTYVEGKIDAMTRPKWLSSKAEFQLHFSKMVFSNGYTVELPGAAESAANAASQTSAGTGSAITTAATEAAIAAVYVDVSSRSDVLLDNGSQIEMVLQSPLLLDAASVASAARHSKPPQVGPYASATRCVPSAGTPGTPDTVIPGTPGSPGTPDTVIPGGPGMPPTVIPGIPATPGTPPTILPGTPGTPGTACPGPPAVRSAPGPGDVHTKSFEVNDSVMIGGTQLTKGKYEITWTGLGPIASVDIHQKNKLVVRVEAHVVALGEKAQRDGSTVRANPDGSVSVSSLQFKGEDLAISFD